MKVKVKVKGAEGEKGACGHFRLKFAEKSKRLVLLFWRDTKLLVGEPRRCYGIGITSSEARWKWHSDSTNTTFKARSLKNDASLDTVDRT